MSRYTELRSSGLKSGVHLKQLRVQIGRNILFIYILLTIVSKLKHLLCTIVMQLTTEVEFIAGYFPN